MTNKESVITVTQVEGFKCLKENLNHDRQYEYRQIREVLKENFTGINNDQCSSLIHRAHKHKDGVLVKEDKNYYLRSSTKESFGGLDRAKHMLEETIKEIEKIPTSEIKTVEEFKGLHEFLSKLKSLVE
ncbi:hypothetical protein P9X10_01370 [Bacillus cereus]|nr:hypothetical protein [Bacillus cereus]